MERERREREALEQSERTRLKRAAAKHIMALWKRRWPLAGGRSSIPRSALHSSRVVIGSMSSARHASNSAKPTSATSTSTSTLRWVRWCARCPASGARRTRHSRGRSGLRGGRGTAMMDGCVILIGHRWCASSASRPRTSAGGSGRSRRRRKQKPDGATRTCQRAASWLRGSRRERQPQGRFVRQYRARNGQPMLMPFVRAS